MGLSDQAQKTETLRLNFQYFFFSVITAIFTNSVRELALLALRANGQTWGL